MRSYDEARERVIVALDVPDRAAALAAVDELKGLVGAFKIGLQLFTSEGPGFVREVVEGGNRVFLDVKYHDIPNTVAGAAVQAAGLGVWMLNVHASGGGEMMKAAADAVRESSASTGIPAPKLIGVTVLTSSNEKTLHETGITQDLNERVLQLAQLTAKCGLDGVVASPRETVAIRQALGAEEFLIVTPGIRPSGATNDDQKRVMTPAEAIASGSDYLVIGRPIMSADDRASAAHEIVSQMIG